VISSVIFSLLVFTVTWVSADGGNTVRARLNGFEEVPSKSTTGRGTFRATIDEEQQVIRYRLSYSDMETPVEQAHVHFGQRAVNGGIMFFLCGGGDKPPCPPISGTVTGVVDPSDIIGPTSQGIEPGSFAEAVRALRSGFTYANVHTTRFPGGEIRGQIKGDRDDKDDDSDSD
jgi:hypothetical protein